MSRPSSVLSNIFSLGHSYGNAWFRYSECKLPLLTATKSVRDIDEDTTRVVLETYAALNTKDCTLDYLSSNNVPIMKPVFYDISLGSKTFSAYHNKDNKPIIELNTPTEGFKIDASNYHGKFQGDVWFGGVSWSNDERYVAYTANEKEDKSATAATKSSSSETLFDKNHYMPLGADPSTTSNSHSKFDFKEDWGEKFEGVSNLVIGILDTHTGKVITLSADVAECTIGCPVFHSTSTHQLIFTKWSAKPRRLGIIHCHQRACSIHLVDLTNVLTSTTTTSSTLSSSPSSGITSDFSIDSPSFIQSAHPTCLTSELTVGRIGRFSPNGRHLVILGRKKQATSHNACYELYRVDLPTTNAATTGDDNISVLTPTAIFPSVAKLIVPIVYTPKSRSDFPGLFVDQISSRCFLDDSSNIILTSGWCSTDAILKINIHTGTITKLNDIITSQLFSSGNHDDKHTSQTDRSDENAVSNPVGLCDNSAASCYALETIYNSVAMRSYITCTTSSPAAPSRIGIMQFDHTPTSSLTAANNVRVWKSVLPPRFLSVSSKIQFGGGSGNNQATAMKQLAQVSDHVRQQLDSMRWKVLSFYSVDNDNSVDNKRAKQCKNINSSRYECILLLPPPTPLPSTAAATPAVPLPLVVVPHGGPHACLTTQFLPAYSYLSVALGAAVLLVNYRGSTNFGQSSIDSLLGKIGTNDVADLMQCVEDLLKNGADDVKFDARKVSIVGGSHGGFLGAHIIGQYPNLCSSAVLRNPVTNIPSMTTFSDIPDWCFIESGGADSYDFTSSSASRTPTAVELAVMAAQSPVAYIDSVKTPTLLCLGRQDKRVPSGQGIEYYHLLRSRGVSVRLLSFPDDTHAIDRPVSEAEQWVATAQWIQRHFSA